MNDIDVRTDRTDRTGSRTANGRPVARPPHAHGIGEPGAPAGRGGDRS